MTSLPKFLLSLSLADLAAYITEAIRQKFPQLPTYRHSYICIIFSSVLLTSIMGTLFKANFSLCAWVLSHLL